jgi:serine/threonine-protein kinase CHEK2
MCDFGGSQIIQGDGTSTELYGTPAYIAPELLYLTKENKWLCNPAVDIWSAGVVLYICLCGLPPFSNDLYPRHSPYKLADQIQLGTYNYPSPEWDFVSDQARDLIDRMLTLDPVRRITAVECLRHAWTTGGVHDEE